MGWIVSKCSKGFFIDQQMWHQAAPASALEGAIIRSATQLWSLLQIPGVLGKSRLHAGEDLVHLVRRVHVPIAVLLAVQHSAPNNLHLQVAGCVRSALPCHLHLVSKLGLKFLAMIKIMTMMLVVVVIMMMAMMMVVVICMKTWPQVPEDSVYWVTYLTKRLLNPCSNVQWGLYSMYKRMSFIRLFIRVEQCTEVTCKSKRAPVTAKCRYHHTFELCSMAPRLLVQVQRKSTKLLNHTCLQGYIA